MSRIGEVILSLVEPSLPASERGLRLREFAHETGWVPSFDIDYPCTSAVANGHIVVEHGMDNAAVISFLRRGCGFGLLNRHEQLDLLAISYNNLVDWHLFPDPYGLTIIHNRMEPLTPQRVSVDERPDLWTAGTFENLVTPHPAVDLKSLDETLIETIRLWKRALAGELERGVSNEALSALFNSIIFARAIEDQMRWRNAASGRRLIEIWRAMEGPKTILTCIERCFHAMGKNLPSRLLEIEKLRVFDSLSEDTVLQLLGDFYQGRFIPYRYDFSLISKHALSRIYEHYVSILQREDSLQLTFFPDLAIERRNKAMGVFYTPQYIGRFFARYLKENLTPKQFRDLKVADPACGSGVFLRTILEMQCDPWQEVNLRTLAEEAFRNIIAIDIDPNACQATRLSLALLYLVLREDIPEELNVINAESIGYFQDHPELQESKDAVIANPPFIAWDDMEPTLQDRVARFMSHLAIGKTDAYLAHLKMGLDMLKPGGFLLYVLPHSFLIARNARAIREKLAQEGTIRFVADLSEINVFEDLGSYVILLVFQKHGEGLTEGQKATVVKCRNHVGRALQFGLEGKSISKDLYEVYSVDQSFFKASEWTLLPPRQIELRTRIQQFTRLETLASISEGFVTGADDIFIRAVSEVDKNERKTYLAYLSDREMRRFQTPKRTAEVVFYPYVDGKRIGEEELQSQYPQTWDYLCSHATDLRQRGSVVKGTCAWWSPERPRPPENMLRAKIVSPHLMLLPRFSLDEVGRYAVSRSPVIMPKQVAGGSDLLYYLVGVLNSSVIHWQIAMSSHKYRSGYLLLEPKTLRGLRVPDPAHVPATAMSRIHSITQDAVQGKIDRHSEQELDRLVADLYGMTKEERDEIGMEC